MEHTSAIFHARDRMDEAVHELTDRGVEPERIHVDSDPHPSREPAPHALFDMPFRVHYAGLGAALGMLVGLWISGAPTGGETMTTIWLVIVGALLGGFIGMFVGMVVGGIRKVVWRDRVTPRRFVMRVDCEGPDECGAVERTLAQYGGEPEPA